MSAASSSSTSQGNPNINNSRASGRSCSPPKPIYIHPLPNFYGNDGRIGDAENMNRMASSGYYDVVYDREQERYRSPRNGERIPVNNGINERPPAIPVRERTSAERIAADEASLALRRIMFGNLSNVSYRRFDHLIDKDFEMHHMKNDREKKNQLKGKLQWPFKKLYNGIKKLF